MDRLEINGEPPYLVGLECEALLVQQFVYMGLVEDPANVVFIKAAGQWHRLYFDCGVIFWRRNDEEPEAYEAPEIEAVYPLFDVSSVREKTISELTMNPLELGAEVEILFEDGTSVVFRNERDRTDMVGKLG